MYIAAALALVAAALAAPTMSHADTSTPCTFGTYRCTTPNTGIEVCDIGGHFELVGDCPKGTDCQNLPQNGFTLPFCTNTPKLKARGGDNDNDKDKDNDKDNDKDRDKDNDKHKDNDNDKDKDNDKDRDHDNRHWPRMKPRGGRGNNDNDGNRRPQSPPSPKPGDKCQTPGQYQCFGNNAIQVCDVLHILELVGNCPSTAHCAYINNIPYCVVNGF